MSSPEPTSVRRPGAGDADAIAAVQNQGWRETYAQLLPESFYDDAALERRKGMWRRLVGRADDTTRLMVAERDGTVIGFAFAGPSPDAEPARELHLFSIYVLADHHGTGAGQALLDAVLGDEAAQLWVARDNPRARAFYRRNGFHPDGTEQVDSDLNDLVEVRMVR
ncbi:GNAT family N-acetyltransferase [Georgenia subflava]|uniref:GNAT family N-acetyltransferase n=1 Tax=Georgenia subflava TaxID=1622177 RepID=A0A6N7EG80_9MICO|nr:GNAT family N-acetyltransferase [Georgenia subflava]MPV37040.1 GNAT family N-acetyltransferase [Georgenia subflava]